MAIQRFEQLEVWQAAHKLVLRIYGATRALPSDHKFGLVSQMQRSAVSVPANIAEGFKRRGRQDKAHFYNIAQASLEELRYYIILCRDLVTELSMNLSQQMPTESAGCCTVSLSH